MGIDKEMCQTVNIFFYNESRKRDRKIKAGDNGDEMEERETKLREKSKDEEQNNQTEVRRWKDGKTQECRRVM